MRTAVTLVALLLLASAPPAVAESVRVVQFLGPDGLHGGYVSYDVCEGAYATVFIEGVTPQPVRFAVTSVKTPNMCLPGPAGPFALAAFAWNETERFAMTAEGAGLSGFVGGAGELALAGTFRGYAFASAGLGASGPDLRQA